LTTAVVATTVVLMVLAFITILGRRFRLVLEEDRGSLPPATFDTTAEAEPVSGPGLAKALPSNVVVLPRRRVG
jgi:hypothetical protein